MTNIDILKRLTVTFLSRKLDWLDDDDDDEDSMDEYYEYEKETLDILEKIAEWTYDKNDLTTLSDNVELAYNTAMEFEEDDINDEYSLLESIEGDYKEFKKEVEKL